MTIVVISVPLGLYWLHKYNPSGDQAVIKPCEYRQRTRKALLRLAQQDECWEPARLRQALRQLYRSLQKLRLSGDWESMRSLVAPGILREWRHEYRRREEAGLQWFVKLLDVVDVQPINLQKQAGFDQNFVTVEIETRRRDYVQGPEGYFQEGSGHMSPTPDQIPIEICKEYWTVQRYNNYWVLVLLSRDFPDNLAFIDESDSV